MKVLQCFQSLFMALHTDNFADIFDSVKIKSIPTIA
jgi:hypothetical protein